MTAAPGGDALLAQGMAHQQAGRADEARRCFDGVLAMQPDSAAVLHRRGLQEFAAARYCLAIEHLAHAVALQPGVALFHHNLGIACGAAGEPAWAARCFARAIAIDPAAADSHYNLGAICLRRGELAAAADALRAALALTPAAADVHALFGLVQHRLGHRAAAEAALALALALQQDTPTVHSALAALLVQFGRLAEGEAHYRAALRLAPGDAVIWCNLGSVLRDLGRLDAAEGALRMAIYLGPARADAHCALGNVLTAAGRFAEADDAYAAALARDEDHADTHYSRGNLHLLTGRLREGWDGFAWRWRRPGFAPPQRFAQPLWDGEALGEAGLLLHAEQGFGDTIQMARYVALVARHSRVVLQVPPALTRLMARLPGVAHLCERGDRMPAFAAHCPLLSLPQVLGTTLETIPAAVPYLQADPAAVSRWRQRLAGLAGPCIGLVWAGNPGYAADNRRSIPEQKLAALAALGCTFVSLQLGGAPALLPLRDWTGELGDFADTAALVDALDLVVSVDTAVAHLAGALGKPVWLMNRYDTCWRWLSGRADSPWYPTLRLFRQPYPGDWDGVLADIAAALAVRISARAA